MSDFERVGPDGPLDDMSPEVLEAARHLLYHYGQSGGWSPGSFSTALIRALEAADPTNRARLLGAFPEYAAPVGVMSSRGATALASWVQARTAND